MLRYIWSDTAKNHQEAAQFSRAPYKTYAIKKKENLKESTGVVLATYPPKVKSENVHNFRVLKLR